MTTLSHEPATLDAIKFDLEQCREDDRASFSSVTQVIIAAVAALAFVFSALSQADAVKPQYTPFAFYILVTAGIVVAVFSFVAASGIKSSLRYHHMIHLEELINRDPSSGSKKDLFLNWTELSSPIITLNIRHIRSGYTLLHFCNLTFTTLTALVVCLLFLLFIFAKTSHNDNLLKILDTQCLYFQIAIILLLLLWLIVFFISMFFGACNTKRLYARAKELAYARRGSNSDSLESKAVDEQKTAAPTDTAVKTAILYFIYPRPGDALKIFFVAIGCALGINLTSGLAGDAIAFYCFIAIFVIDYLVYQARYQWNDIRGANEDRKNPEALLRKRLPVNEIGLKRAVIISSITMGARIILAVIICIALPPDRGIPLLVCSALVFALAILYELSREKKYIKATLFLVCLGYPLRIVAGLLMFSPELMTASAIAPITTIDIATVILFFLIASAAFGCSFVWITWALEGADQFTKGEVIYKPHISYLVAKLRAPAETYPLLHGNLLQDPWNASMAACVLLLGLLTLASPELSYSRMILAVACPIAFWVILTHPRRWKLSALVLLGLALVASFMPSLFGSSFSLTGASIVIYLSSTAYLSIYGMFLTTNYTIMSDFRNQIKRAIADIKALSSKAITYLAVLLVGEDTFQALLSDQDKIRKRANEFDRQSATRDHTKRNPKQPGFLSRAVWKRHR